jgi:hypothetical protein
LASTGNLLSVFNCAAACCITKMPISSNSHRVRAYKKFIMIGDFDTYKNIEVRGKKYEDNYSSYLATEGKSKMINKNKR